MKKTLRYSTDYQKTFDDDMLHIIDKFRRNNLHIDVDFYSHSPRRYNILNPERRKYIEDKFKCKLVGYNNNFKILIPELRIDAKADYLYDSILIDAGEDKRDIIFNFLYNIDNKTNIIGDNKFISIYF